MRDVDRAVIEEAEKAMDHYSNLPELDCEWDFLRILDTLMDAVQARREAPGEADLPKAPALMIGDEVIPFKSWRAMDPDEFEDAVLIDVRPKDPLPDGGEIVCTFKGKPFVHPAEAVVREYIERLRETEKEQASLEDSENTAGFNDGYLDALRFSIALFQVVARKHGIEVE